MTLRFGCGTNGFAGHRLPDVPAILTDLGYDGVAHPLNHVHLEPFAADAPRTPSPPPPEPARW